MIMVEYKGWRIFYRIGKNILFEDNRDPLDLVPLSPISDRVSRHVPLELYNSTEDCYDLVFVRLSSLGKLRVSLP